jgi:hypothetical protein
VRPRNAEEWRLARDKSDSSIYLSIIYRRPMAGGDACSNLPRHPRCAPIGCAATGAFQSLLERFSAAGAAGLKAQARLRSSASRPASIFLDTLPMAPPLTISDAALASGMRHYLGLSQMPAGARMVACDCAEQPTPPPP